MTPAGFTLPTYRELGTEFFADHAGPANDWLSLTVKGVCARVLARFDAGRDDADVPVTLPAGYQSFEVLSVCGNLIAA